MNRRTVQSPRVQRGFNLIELLVSMTITLVVVLAAAVVYLNTRESENAQSRKSDSLQAGEFGLQLLGRDIAQAGSYPVLIPVTTPYFKEGGRIGSLPQQGWSFPPQDWAIELPGAAYQTAVFGCDGGTFNPTTAACDASVAIAPYRSPPDTIVINYFSADATNLGSVGNRFDCTGANAGGAAVNNLRKLNAGTQIVDDVTFPVTEVDTLPPHRPLFVSNRYTLSDTNTQADLQTVVTRSLTCHGNGNTLPIYQPLMLGIEDLQITYGVAPVINAGDTSLQLTPNQFLSAAQVSALSTVDFGGVLYPPWQQITAVRVCLMTRTTGNVRLADKAGEARTYLDCTDETPQAYAATDRSLRNRHVQVFALRNRLTQTH